MLKAERCSRQAQTESQCIRYDIMRARLTQFYEYVVSAPRARQVTMSRAQVLLRSLQTVCFSSLAPPTLSLPLSIVVSRSISLSLPLSPTLSPSRSLPLALSLSFALYLSLPSLLRCDLFACDQNNDITDRTAVYATPSLYQSYEGSVHVCVQRAIDNYTLCHIHGARSIGRAPHYM